MILFVVLLTLHLMLLSISTLILHYQKIKLAGTSVVYPLIVQILALTSSLLIYSVRRNYIIINFTAAFYGLGYIDLTGFVVVGLPSDMTVFPQEYKLNCSKMGHFAYNGLTMKIASTLLLGYIDCNDNNQECGDVLDSTFHRVRFSVNVTWDGMTVSSSLNSRSTTGDQTYECSLTAQVSAYDTTRTLTIKGNELIVHVHVHMLP